MMKLNHGLLKDKKTSKKISISQDIHIKWKDNKIKIQSKMNLNDYRNRNKKKKKSKEQT